MRPSLFDRRQWLLLGLGAATAPIPTTLFAQAATPARPDEPPRPAGGERRPPREGGDGREGRDGREDRAPRDPRQRYSLQQAMSEKAQLHTIAFSGLAFLSGDFAADTFLPPGKIADYFGFQYLRDIDAAEGGHSPAFLTRIAFALLGLLKPPQQAVLLELAQRQQDEVRRFGLQRLPLIRALRLQLDGRLPAGSTGLDREAVRRHSARLYELDGRIALGRAAAMAQVLRSFDDDQRQRMAAWRFGDSRTWPAAVEPPGRRERGHTLDVALMTLASEMYAWGAGSLDADTYFCPERHAMYFGGFGLKTAPAQGRQDFAISTALTGDAGAEFLALLDAAQQALVRELPRGQVAELAEIAALRRRVAVQLRRGLAGERPDDAAVLRDSARYGELDGELTWRYARAFTAVARSLSPAQWQAVRALRARAPQDPRGPRGPFLYAEPLDAEGLREAEQFAPLLARG